MSEGMAALTAGVLLVLAFVAVCIVAAVGLALATDVFHAIA